MLTYAAPEVCPGEGRFIAEVASHVHDTSRAWSVRVNVTIEEHAPGYVGTLVAFDRSGKESSRRIADKTCSDVANALAFLAALVIELGGHTEPEAPSTPTPPTPPPPLQLEPPADSAGVARPRSTALSMVFLGGVRGGLGPSVRPSGDAGVEVSLPGGMLAPSLRLGGFAGSGSLEGTAGSATLWLAGGNLELCPLRFGNARFVVRPCVGAEVGVIHAAGQIEYGPRAPTEPWVSAEATFRGQWFATKSWFFELGGGLVAPFVRTRYYVEPDRTLYVVPSLTAEAAIGVGFVFW